MKQPPFALFAGVWPFARPSPYDSRRLLPSADDRPGHQSMDVTDSIIHDLTQKAKFGAASLAKVVLKLLTFAMTAQFGQCFGFNLTNSLSGDTKLEPNLL